jgi:hypothetical protein
MRTTKSSRILNLPGKGLWTQIRLCPCCGNFVVKLRLPEKRKFIVCYHKGWDGNPWYTESKVKDGRPESGNAYPHRPKGKKRKPRAPVEGYDREEYFKNRAAEKKDPFFSLDG